MDVRDALYGRGLRRRLDARVEREQLAPPPVTDVVTEADLASLPEPAQRWLRFMGAVGRPPVTSFEVRMRGRFRQRPGQRWMHCEAWQYNQGGDIARLFHMRIDFAAVVPMFGWDVYVGGRGHMKGKLAGLVIVAAGRGPEFDAGELVTWLNDACMLAPSMLLGAPTTWTTVDDHSFSVAVTDRGTTVTARLHVDDDGRLVDFVTDDRWCSLPDGLVRSRWSTPIAGWTTADDGAPMGVGGRAIWHLSEGDFAYADMRFDGDTLTRSPMPPVNVPS